MPTGLKQVGRGISWSLAGNALPVLVGLLTIPQLLQQLGREAFALLLLVWAVVGYFSLFDLGLGRALTRELALALAQGQGTAHRQRVVWSSLWMLLGLGGLALLCVWALRPWLAGWLAVGPTVPEPEVAYALGWLAAGLPLVLLGAGLRGVLEAHQQFARLAVLGAGAGALNFALPWWLAQQQVGLVGITAGLVVIRLGVVVALALSCVQTEPAARRPTPVCRRTLGALLGFGGWLTVSNLIGPIMVYFDRFVLTAWVPLASVAFYLTPSEVLSRLQVITGSVNGVLFPALSRAWHTQHDVPWVFRFGLIAHMALMAFPATLLMFGAPEWLTLWLGADFAREATAVAQWLVWGWMLNALAHPALMLLQAAGRADWVAKLHAAECVPYWVLMAWATAMWGIEGTAMAWFARVLADACAMMALALRAVPAIRPQWPLFAAMLAGGLAGGAAAMWLTDAAWRMGAWCTIWAMLAPVLWQQKKRWDHPPAALI